MTAVITSIPSTGVDCAFGKNTLATDAIWTEPALGVNDPFTAALRMGDSSLLDGCWSTILSTAYQPSRNAIVRVDGERVRVQNLRFSNARYGIATPTAFDTAPKRGHSFSDIYGSANDRAFRVSGIGTRLERFAFGNIIGSTADAESMAFGVELLGPSPVVRNGQISNLVPIDQPGGLVAEAVGLSFSNGCVGGFAENIQITNPNLIPGNTFGVWVGGGSYDVHLRGITVSHMGIAFGLASSSDLTEGSGGLLEDCISIGCGNAFDDINLTYWRRRNCIEVKTNPLTNAVISITTYND